MSFKQILQKKFSKDFIWSLSSTGILSIIGILINIIVGNYYGTEGLGIYSFGFSLYILFSTLSIFGLKASSIKITGEYFNQPEKRDLAMKASLVISGISSIVVVLAIYLFYRFGWGGNNFADSISIFFALPLYTINEVFFGYINGLRKMKLYSILRTLRWALAILFILTSISLKIQVKSALFSFFAAEIILLTIFIVTNKSILFKPIANIKRWIKQHLYFGLKIISTDLVHQLDNKLSILLLSTLLTKSDVGIFSFASTIASGLLMIPGTIAMNFDPIIANLWKNNRERLKKYIKQVQRWSVLITLPLYGMCAVAYPFLIKYIMKERNYTQSIPVFYILLIGNISLTLIRWASGLLTMTGYPQERLKAKIIILVINFILSILLIKSYGIVGSAIATTITSIIWTIIIVKTTKKKLELKLV